MTRVYTVKSNARRDCRKLGLNPDLVVQAKGGFIIKYPDAKPTKKVRSAAVAKQTRKKRDGDLKGDRLIAMLADWTPIGDLVATLGWQAHTVRSAISTGSRALGITIERQRIDGVTSYRIGSEAEAVAA